MESDGAGGWRAVLEQALHVYRIKPVRTLAELARHRDRPLLLQHVPDLVGAQRTQQARDAVHAAAALELHRPAAEQAQVVAAERAREQPLGGLVQQPLAIEQLDAVLRGLPGRMRGLIGRSLGKLLHQETRDLPVVGGEPHPGRQLLGGGEIGLERLGERAAG